jgi:hypothetical protein
MYCCISVLLYICTDVLLYWVSPCRAAVHFEKGDYEQCIKDCDQAVEEGRAMRADFTLIAK